MGRLERAQPQARTVFHRRSRRRALRGGVHIQAPTGTPLANAMLSSLHALGHDDLASFGDSEGALSRNPG
jgi:hypothetical protein